MKLASVDRALKELQNDSSFVGLRLILLYKQIQMLKVPVPALKILRSEFYTSCCTCTKQFTDKNGIIL